MAVSVFRFPNGKHRETFPMFSILENGKHLPKTQKKMDRRKENKINLNVDPGWPSHQVRLYRRFLLEAFYMTIPHHVALRLWIVSGYDAKKIAKETGLPLKTCYIYHEAYKYNFI
ncbi:MAG: hypothetical protein PUC94_08410 [Bacteroidales bacterium]|nr:hypothetical protein [Bacteroidales bacterium]